MGQPNCSIVVTFFGENDPTFTYFCVEQPPPWHVGQEGNICPTTRSRIVELRLESDPPGAEVIGFKLATTANALNHPDLYYNDTSITVTHSKTNIVLDDNSSTTPVRIFYALGIQCADGTQHWDDPKIYNPPDD